MLVRTGKGEEFAVIVGVPKEVKDNEFRVAATPEGVLELTHAAVSWFRTAPGGFVAAAGALCEGRRRDRGDRGRGVGRGGAEMILKVKEPVEQEYDLMQEGQLLFTYLHLAAVRPLTEKLIERKVAAVAYETVQDTAGRLPLLAPMSEVAGRMAPHVGARLLEKEYGGPGHPDGRGIGRSARQGPGARRRHGRVERRMTTHSDPTYLEEGVIHYCVGNMPGAVPNTSTYALTNVTLPYILAMAELGLQEAVRRDPALALGVNAFGGALTNHAVAEAHGLPSSPLADVLPGGPRVRTGA